MTDEDIVEKVQAAADASFADKVERVGLEQFTPFMRMVLLQSIDQHWREHLAALDYLRQGIHLRGYAQKNPKQEYKREAFELFSQLLDVVKMEVDGGRPQTCASSPRTGTSGGRGGDRAARRAVRERHLHASNRTARSPRMPMWRRRRERRQPLVAVAAGIGASVRTSSVRRSVATTPVPRQRQEVQALPRPLGT